MNGTACTSRREQGTSSRSASRRCRPLSGRPLSVRRSGATAGETVIGLGNASLDLQSLINDLGAGETFRAPFPFRIGRGRGLVEASAGTVYLLQFRDAELNLSAPRTLEFSDELCHDLPAWWLLKRKRTMFHTGSTDARSIRSNVAFFLAPSNSGEFLKSRAAVIADIREYLLTLEPPRYPFPIDRDLAARGELHFVEHCSTCHGTHGGDRQYPNLVVRVDEVGTDPALATFGGLPYFRESWLFRETGPEGQPYHLLDHGGYQAPPLDGVWATAPYLHNGSVPTIGHLLDSKTRPAIYTRTFGTERDDYDPERVGWKVTPVEPTFARSTVGHEQRRITDTSQPGRGNAGHTYGDDLTPDERRAILEYLKTL